MASMKSSTKCSYCKETIAGGRPALKRHMVKKHRIEEDDNSLKRYLDVRYDTNRTIKRRNKEIELYKTLEALILRKEGNANKNRIAAFDVEEFIRLNFVVVEEGSRDLLNEMNVKTSRLVIASWFLHHFDVFMNDTVLETFFSSSSDNSPPLLSGHKELGRLKIEQKERVPLDFTKRNKSTILSSDHYNAFVHIQNLFYVHYFSKLEKKFIANKNTKCKIL